MEQKSNEFIVNLKSLNTQGNRELEKFAKNELINIDDVIKIINSEAERNKINEIVKVTFETLEDDSFQIVVESYEEKQNNINEEKNEVVIVPYQKIKSSKSEITLEDYIGKVTIYNRKESSTYVTIDGVSLNLFSMPYSNATQLLSNIADRREKNGYIDEGNKIIYKEFGIAVNKDISDEDRIDFIDVFTKFEIERQYHFTEEKYDVDISKVGNSLDYEVPEFNPEELLEENEEEKTPNVEEKYEDSKERLLEDKLSQKLKELDFSSNTINENEDIEIEYEQPLKEVAQEVVESNDVSESNSNDIEYKDEIEELTQLYNKQKEQQEILEKRIEKKLEELKLLSLNINSKKEENKPKIENKVAENVDNTQENTKSFVIESYKGLKEQGKGYLSLYLGQSKDDIRSYFKVTPKEVNDFEEMEMYDNFYAYYDEEDKCTGIGIYNQEENENKLAVYLFGKNLISMPYKDIVKLIKDHDYKAIEDEDGIISLEYGISIDPKEDRNYKESICDVIHIFKKGYYDEVYNV